MARNSFRDAVTGVLKAHGQIEANQPGDIKQVEADSFALQPGKWQWNGSTWAAYTSPEEIRRQQFESTIGGDTVVQNFKSMSPAQFDAWWDANVTTAAQAIAVLKRLVKLIIFRLL